MDIENDAASGEPIHGHRVVSSARTRLTEPSPALVTRGVVVRASRLNSGTIFLGGRSVTDFGGAAPGMPVEPGESITIPVRDPASLWLVSDSLIDQQVAWIAV